MFSRNVSWLWAPYCFSAFAQWEGLTYFALLTQVKGWHSLCRCFVALRFWKSYCIVCERIYGAHTYSLLLWYIWKLRAHQVIHWLFVGRFWVVHFGLLVPVPVYCIPFQSVLGLAGPGGPQMNSKVCFQKCTIQKLPGIFLFSQWISLQFFIKAASASGVGPRAVK